MKKFSCICLTLIFLFSVVLPVSADDTDYIPIDTIYCSVLTSYSGDELYASDMLRSLVALFMVTDYAFMTAGNMDHLPWSTETYLGYKADQPSSFQAFCSIPEKNQAVSIVFFPSSGSLYYCHYDLDNYTIKTYDEFCKYVLSSSDYVYAKMTSDELLTAATIFAEFFGD